FFFGNAIRPFFFGSFRCPLGTRGGFGKRGALPAGRSFPAFAALGTLRTFGAILTVKAFSTVLTRIGTPFACCGNFGGGLGFDFIFSEEMDQGRSDIGGGIVLVEQTIQQGFLFFVASFFQGFPEGFVKNVGALF